MPVPSESFGNFDLVRRVKLDFTDVVVSKWRSRVTGLSVVHLDYTAPIVNGYFVVGTEIFDDSGCPHTLEHLVFMGSDQYPYKGIIDHFANRGFSNGTNAWTDTDHTAYTVSTAGEQGFLQLLPIYVDHILYPKMTQAGFVTEVHHIDPSGQDSGVVYSEMQGRENTSGDLMALRAQQLLDPPGCAYRSETGGLMEALRVLSVEQIRKYHATYYVPHNLTLIVGGKLSSGTSSLLDVVQNKVEPVLISHGQNKGSRPSGWKRPFVETASANRPPIAETIKETIEFPEQDESVGEVTIHVPGSCYKRLPRTKATYLTSSAVAPLNKEFVEIESPLCTYIYFSEDIRASRVYLPIYVGSIPAEHLDTFDQKLKTTFKRIADEGIDMERMAMVINRDERQLRSKLESAKGDTFSTNIITDFLYGAEDGSELKGSMDEINQYNEIRTFSSKQWTDLLTKYFIDPASVIVIGKPSAVLAKKLEEDEKTRVAAQVEGLGPEGLKKAAKELEDAKSEHDRPIPTEVLTKSQVEVEGLHQDERRRHCCPNTCIKMVLTYLSSYNMIMSKSDFVTVHGYFSLAEVPHPLRPHISTYLSAFFALPVQRQSGEWLSHEEVINKLDDETVSYEVGLGVSNAFAETLRVSIKVEVSGYEVAVAWLRDLVYGARFDKERLQVTVAKIQQSLPELKRDGNTVLGSLWADLLYNESSTSRAGGILPQIDFIPKLVKRLQEEPEKVVAEFEKIREHMTDPSGIRFSVTGDVIKLPQPRSVWPKYFQSVSDVPLAPVPLVSDRLSAVGENPVQKAIVMSLPTIESSYVTHSAKCLKGFQQPEYPAIRVALEVLNATESYLWRYIRGSGLAYGAYVSIDLEAGLLSFSLYRSSNSIGAFKEASNVLKGLVDGSVTFDSTTLDAAKSSIVYGITKSVSTASRAASVSFTTQALKGLAQNYQVELLEKLQAVTQEDVLTALRTHFLPLFDPSSSVAVVVTSPAKASEIADGLKDAGFDVESRQLEIDPDEYSSSECDSDCDSDHDHSD
ncbi:Metalloenzyme, LuxS/M16 peptidase-like protein [Armillaria novae-zelandiae]|uniref:Metalloenzyme, LuxS/M16 peptidase-like protein n=1 Tax=Armillaria novae-zelandiae TaxID=153914 RepID=A0AA39UDP2_9AGAR|nr:Metalloenzyme, LuxS/M16 peptidase-like protein [Armillaria novae-zelandiae]